ncbi:hypothetical protein C7212DRAFT_162523, partial [Tuber magnatum]
SSLRRFHPLDLLRLNLVNLHALTETHDASFSVRYLAKWSTLMSVMESSQGNIIGYVMGKAEGTSKDWHGWVTTLTAAPDNCRLGLAKTMMDEVEHVATSVYNGNSVDLSVRISNEIAIGMYKGMGYLAYPTVMEYYSASGGGGGGDEGAYGMRKPMRRDKHRKSVGENGREVRVLSHEVW